MSTSIVTPAQKQQYETDGYFILEDALSDDQLRLLREEAAYAMERINREMDARGTDVLDLNHRGKRYFITNVWKDRPRLKQFLYSDLMADICRQTIGPDAYLFHEQYVIKCGDKASSFSWHQDSGYVHPHHTPYLTCWIPLDDVTEENGTVYLLPYSRVGIRTWVQHVKDPDTNDKVGYFGDDPGIPVIAPAGSIVCFTSLVFHCSGANTTDELRRVYLPQYSPTKIRDEAGEALWQEAEPFLKDGQIVADAPAAA